MIVRNRNRGLVYLRGRTLSSLTRQLTWALGKADEMKIEVTGRISDLSYIFSERLERYDDLRIDVRTDKQSRRPGLSELELDAWVDQSISHVLVESVDRFGRSSLEVLGSVNLLRSFGIEIVLRNQVIAP